MLNAHAARIEASDVLTRLSLTAGQFFLVTLHRAENVDQPDRLAALLSGLARVADRYQQPLVFSVHPRTADKLARFGLDPQSEQVRLLKPLGFFDFVKLERHACGVLSDSGTVQEECCLFNVPNVTVRDVTERAETVEVGTRRAYPSNLPLRSGITSATALAAPVVVGIMLMAAARARRRSLWGRSRIFWSLV